MQFDSTTYRFTDAGKFGTIALIVGIVGLVLSAVGFFVDAGQFFYSWLVAFTFWVTIGLGGLFMTMVHHLTGAVWSVVVRRIGEAVARTLPWMAIFAIPVLLGLDHLYVWTDKEYVASSAALSSKAGYLNEVFFIIRTVIYFAVWSLLAVLLTRTSLAQDERWTEARAKRFVVISGPGMIAFALATTFAGFDWVMSLEPYWYSTIYGLWFFAGGIATVMAFYALTVDMLHKNSVLEGVVTNEHQHDIGKLMFAFLVFWGYMHLSQYLLIWYANLPEETMFYKMRWGQGWTTMSILLIVGGFTIPFLFLMGRSIKRIKPARIFFAIWLFVVHWIDLYWNIMPNYHEETAALSWIDLVTLVGVGGVFLWAFWGWFSKHPIVPASDPRLAESTRLTNY